MRISTASPADVINEMYQNRPGYILFEELFDKSRSVNFHCVRVSGDTVRYLGLGNVGTAPNPNCPGAFSFTFTACQFTWTSSGTTFIKALLGNGEWIVVTPSGTVYFFLNETSPLVEEDIDWLKEANAMKILVKSTPEQSAFIIDKPRF